MCYNRDTIKGVNVSDLKQNILVVDDEDDIRLFISGLLEDEGYSCAQASSVKKAEDIIKSTPPDLVVLDIWLGEGHKDGLTILDFVVSQKNTYIPVIMISGHASVDLAVETIKKGAYDFIEKPFKSNKLLLMVKRAMETASLRNENQALKKVNRIQPPSLSKQDANFMQECILKPLKEARTEFEKHYILTLLEKYNGNVQQASKASGMERTAFYRKVKSLDIQITSKDNDT